MLPNGKIPSLPWNYFQNNIIVYSTSLGTILECLHSTLPATSGSHPKRKRVFQPSIFSCCVSGREGKNFPSHLKGPPPRYDFSIWSLLNLLRNIEEHWVFVNTYRCDRRWWCIDMYLCIKTKQCGYVCVNHIRLFTTCMMNTGTVIIPNTVVELARTSWMNNINRRHKNWAYQCDEWQMTWKDHSPTM